MMCLFMLYWLFLFQLFHAVSNVSFYAEFVDSFHVVFIVSSHAVFALSSQAAFVIYFNAVFVVSSPEHEVLKVRYYDRSMSVVHHPLCSAKNLLLKPTPPTALVQSTLNLVGSMGVIYRSKIGKIILIRNPRWPPWQTSFKICFSLRLLKRKAS